MREKLLTYLLCPDEILGGAESDWLSTGIWPCWGQTTGKAVHPPSVC